MKKLRNTIGTKIREARKSKDLTQTDIADRIGITYQQVQKYESGKSSITIQRAMEIAEAIDIPVTSIMPDDFGTGASKLIIALEAKVKRLESQKDKALAILCM